MLSDRLQGSALEKLKLSDLSDIEIMSLPEASVIATVDWYHCNKLNGLDKEENFKRIITIRKISQSKEVNEKLNQVLEKTTLSLVEFIKISVEAEHEVPLSLKNIEQLILEYKKIRKVD